MTGALPVRPLGSAGPRAMLGLAQAGLPRAVGHLANPTRVVPATMTGEVLNRILEADLDLQCVVVTDPAHPARHGILPRAVFHRRMTGRFGYGWSLYARREIDPMVLWDPVVVDHTDDVERVTASVLARSADTRRDDIIVRWPDGVVGTATTTDLFETMAGLYGHDALHDTLTGLPNRALFRDRLRAALAGPAAGRSLVGVVILDLDDFKGVNDSFGHSAGDSVLVELARRWLCAVGPGETLARLGGDEFALVVPGLHTDSDAVHRAQRFREALREPFDVDGRLVSVHASFGIATGTAGESAEMLLRSADLAMYGAKTCAPDAIRLYDPAMHQSALERLRLEQDLTRAIADDTLTLVYQPVATFAGRSGGVEALVRWNHPCLGPLPPSRFVPIAEASGLITDLDAWVLRRACREAATWPGGLRVAVNVSNRTLDGGRLALLVADALTDVQLDPGRLEIEVTERIAPDDRSRAAETLAELRQWGVRISLDDFGTGYSSLSRLSLLPIDTVKIDRAFVGTLGDGEPSPAIVRAIIAMARALGLAVVAEGVERAGELAFLRASGCDAVQGWLLGRPVPAESVPAAVAAARATARGVTTAVA